MSPTETAQREAYYLDGLDRYKEGDQFPNIGYVRRMTALLDSDRHDDDAG